MASSSKFLKKDSISETTQDIISSLPTDVTDKIMKCLPLTTAAKMSVLSRKWRLNWLSHRYFVFDEAFWEGLCKNETFDSHKISNIISKILLQHNGPVHKFHLYIPADKSRGTNLDVSQWISFLSRIGVKKLTIDDSNFDDCAQLSSYIFACKDLVKLSIGSYELVIPPPTDFKGFAYLTSLKLIFVIFKHDHNFSSLIANCPRLTKFTLWDYGMSDLVIDVRSIEILTIRGYFESLSFQNVVRLRRISVYLAEMNEYVKTEKLVYSINVLASTSQLQYLHLGEHMCQCLSAGCTTGSLTLAFNYLQELCLTELDFRDYNVFCFTFRMLQSCPFIKYLKIRVDHGSANEQDCSKIEYDDNYKLRHLVRVEIQGITGSSAELKLIEYVLSISVVLKELLLTFCKATSEVKVLRRLLCLRRASTKTKLYVSKKKYD